MSLPSAAVVDERLGSLVREGRKRLSRREFLDLANDLLDARLRVTHPRAEPVVCGVYERAVTARPFVNEYGVTYVIDCPNCDFTTCAACRRVVADRRAPLCPAGHDVRVKVWAL